MNLSELSNRVRIALLGDGLSVRSMPSATTAANAGRDGHLIALHRTVMGIVGRHGAFAEFLTLPVENLHFVPDTVSSDRATFVEPLAAALEIGEQVEISNESKVLVVGDGKLGLLIAQSMVNRDCQITTLGRHPKKLEILARLGIRTCRELDPATASFDIAVECTGNNQGTEVALKSLRPRGILVLKSTYHGRLKLDMSAVVVNEITLIGSRCGPFPQAIEMIRQGKIDLDSMISGRFPLAQGVDAFEAAAARGALKILVDIE